MRVAATLLFLSLVFIGISSFKPLAPKERAIDAAINWLTWEEAISKCKVQKRKLLVDVYTDWCGWCKRMDQATFGKKHMRMR